MTPWELLEKMDPELYAKTNAWRKGIDAEPAIPAKYQEMMKLAMASVLRFDAAIISHTETAIAAGATKEELFATLAQAMMLGGIPAYRNAATLLADTIMGLK